RLLEGETIAGRAARVRLDHDISAACERCRVAAEPVVRLAGRPAMRKHDRRVASVSLKVERHGDDRADERPVETLVRDDPRLRQMLWREGRKRKMSELRALPRREIKRLQFARSVGARM